MKNKKDMRNTKRTGIAYRGVCDEEKWNECYEKKITVLEPYERGLDTEDVYA